MNRKPVVCGYCRYSRGHKEEKGQCSFISRVCIYGQRDSSNTAVLPRCSDLNPENDCSYFKKVRKQV